MDFNSILNAAIQGAQAEIDSLRNKLNTKRRYPTPSRYQQRKIFNFIDSKFSSTTSDKDFVVNLNGEIWTTGGKVEFNF